MVNPMGKQKKMINTKCRSEHCGNEVRDYNATRPIQVIQAKLSLALSSEANRHSVLSHDLLLYSVVSYILPAPVEHISLFLLSFIFLFVGCFFFHLKIPHTINRNPQYFIVRRNTPVYGLLSKEQGSINGMLKHSGWSNRESLSH